MHTDQIWWELIIPSLDNCAGESIANLLSFISQAQKLEYAACSDMNGFADLWSLPRPKTNELLVVALPELIRVLPDINQLCWSDFFLCANFETASAITADEKMPLSIIKSVTTVRTVDQTYFYIYTQDENLVNNLKQDYDVVETRKGNVFYFGFPF